MPPTTPITRFVRHAARLFTAVALLFAPQSLAAQVARAGATRIEGQHLVVYIFPDSLAGMQLNATVRLPGGGAERQTFRLHVNPAAAESWLQEAERLADTLQAADDTVRQVTAPWLSDVAARQGVTIGRIRRDGKWWKQVFWMFQGVDHDQPLIAPSDREFTRQVLAGIRAAVPYSAVDSAASAAGLVPPSLALADSGAHARPISIPIPRYPGGLRDDGMDGLVHVRYVVGPDGRADMTTFEALWASDKAFIAAARDAIAEGRFQPARVDGVPVRQRVQHSVRFVVGGRGVRWE